MAVKIRLKRLGKIREPYYRIVVADSRTKRDGRAIEEIGKYHPKLEPSLIEIDSERVQYWLSVGAQPTEPVQHLLTITGDWQKFKGLPGTEGTLKTGEAEGRQEGPLRGAREGVPRGQGGQGRRQAGQVRAQKASRRRPRPRRPSREGRPRRPSRGRAEPRLRRPRPPRLRPPRPAPRPAPRPRGRARPPLASPPRPEVLEEALEHLVRGIVTHPDDVRVVSRMLRRGNVLEVRVHPDDLGKVIGRGGRTARALRTVIGSLAGNRHVRIDLLETGEVR